LPGPISVPRASRPESGGDFLPADRGIGLLPWLHVERAFEDARNFWLATSTRDGRPHSMPVWGVWSDDGFAFRTNAGSRKARNLDHNPHAVVHLESGERVVVMEGRVESMRATADIEAFRDVYNGKYGFAFTADQLARSRVYRLRPQKVFAWLGSEGEAFSGTATRWVFDPD